MFGIGMTELLVIFVIGLLVLGPKRLPELARNLGRSLAEFRRASLDIRKEFMDVAEEARISPAHLEAAGRSGKDDPGEDVPPQAGQDTPDAPPTTESKPAAADDRDDEHEKPHDPSAHG